MLVLELGSEGLSVVQLAPQEVVALASEARQRDERTGRTTQAAREREQCKALLV